MAARVLIDSNLLIYAHDGSEPERQPRALALLDLMQDLQLGALSVQCLSEYFAVITRKFDPPMSAADAAAQVQRLAEAWPTFEITPAVVIEAARGVVDHQLAYWDAVIWAVAKLNQLDTVLSEDCQHGRVLEGVRFVNPFAAGAETDEALLGWIGP
jgi:predicted nucleic acid-binding protein